MNSGLSEIRGKNVQYSKFWNVNFQSPTAKQRKLSSRTGMLLAYTPAFLAAVASLAIFSEEGFRFLFLCSALTIHFFKRLFEVLFIHKYSGGINLDVAISISLNYFLITTSMVYTQYLSKEFTEPLFDLKNPGIILFLVGIIGNFYHHYILSKLRQETGDKEYKIPMGGLFKLVICPHYLFEIVGFIGVSFISQTLYAFCFTFGSMFYLMGRSYATKRWYDSKFEDFPKDVKALVPYVF